MEFRDANEAPPVSQLANCHIYDLVRPPSEGALFTSYGDVVCCNLDGFLIIPLEMVKERYIPRKPWWKRFVPRSPTR